MEKRIAIYIPTYKRCVLLERCIKSVNESLKLIPDNYIFEIIIVDNDINESARVIAMRAKEILDIEVRYITEHKKGYSYVRNRCINDCLQNIYDYFVFIDDDEVATKLWMKKLIESKNSYNADIVLGPVSALYDELSPDWMKKIKFHEKNLFLKNGTVISPRNCRTDNVLVCKKVIGDTRFDMNFNLIGSEDYKFFIDLHKKGNIKIVWADNAYTQENVPIERTKLKYLLIRAYRVGIARSVLDKCYYENKFKSYLIIIIKFIYNIVKGTGITVTSLFIKKDILYRGLRLIACGCGRLSAINKKYNFNRSIKNENSTF